MILRRWFLTLAALVFVSASSNRVWAQFDSAKAPTSGLEIQRVTPDGKDVPAAKQIVITFNRPVVAVGKMDRTAAELPITINPALSCSWRWINSSALACNLPDKAPLQPATNYTVDIAPGITTEDGATLRSEERRVGKEC